jgi:hypothetical protein
MVWVIANPQGEAIQAHTSAGLPRRYAPRNDDVLLCVMQLCCTVTGQRFVLLL